MKYLLASILILLNIQFVQSQDYIPLNFDTGEWNCAYMKKGGLFGDIDHGSYYAYDSITFSSGGDTIINGVGYKKLMYSGYTNSQNVEKTYISGYHGAVRNDTVHKHVYFIPSNKSADFEPSLLYDFNLSIGDSIQVSSNLIEDKEVISKIDSIVYCNTYYKRFITPSGYYIIEGIGSKNGLFPLYMLPNTGSLVCYKERNNEFCEECDYSTSVRISPIIDLDVFPNPSTGIVHISSNISILTVRVFDANGVLVEYLDSGFESIELKEKGCYFIQVQTREGVITQKVINE